MPSKWALKPIQIELDCLLRLPGDGEGSGQIDESSRRQRYKARSRDCRSPEVLVTPHEL